ncbi:MAG: hypothetical protein SOU51_01605 [Collinsella sp.]|nr:hypothetical protein [Collinsella sp.]
MNRGKLIGIAISAILLVAVLSFALAPQVSPSRSLAPSIFISYDEDGIESRIIFSVSEDGQDASVSVSDENGLSGSFKIRQISDTAFEYEPSRQEVRFSGRVWHLSGDTGARRLENISSEDGVLWGTYYEDKLEARSAEPYRRDDGAGMS